MKIRIDGNEYAHDTSRLMLSDARDIKTATGMGPNEFNAGLETDDPFATTALLWIIRRRAGEPDLRFEDVDGNLATLEIVADVEPTPDPTTAAPATSGSAASESRSI